MDPLAVILIVQEKFLLDVGCGHVLVKARSLPPYFRLEVYQRFLNTQKPVIWLYNAIKYHLCWGGKKFFISIMKDNSSREEYCKRLEKSTRSYFSLTGILTIKRNDLIKDQTWKDIVADYTHEIYDLSKDTGEHATCSYNPSYKCNCLRPELIGTRPGLGV